jgi:hypothetical protein
MLEKPELEVIEEEGRTCLYARLQDRATKAVRAIQPDPATMIYFYLDRGGFPVGIKFLEFVPCAAMLRVLRETAGPYLLKEPLLVERIMQAFESAAEQMPEHSIGTL